MLKAKIRKIRVPRIQPNKEEWELGQKIAAPVMGKLTDVILDYGPIDESTAEELFQFFEKDEEDVKDQELCPCVGSTFSLNETGKMLVCNRCGAVVIRDYWDHK